MAFVLPFITCFLLQSMTYNKYTTIYNLYCFTTLRLVIIVLCFKTYIILQSMAYSFTKT